MDLEIEKQIAEQRAAASSNGDTRSGSREKERDKERDRDRERRRDESNSKPERRRSRSRDRERRRRSRSKDRKKKSRSRERRRSRSQSRSRRRKTRSKSRERDRDEKRRRKPYKYWDKPPAGFEHITPMQYKAMQAAGQIPAINLNVPSAPMTMHTTIPFAGNAVSRQARRLYIGNIPFGVTEEMMMEFFNTQMKMAGLAQAEGNPVIACQVNLDKNFAFLELRSVDECTQVTALDGINFMGQSLKVKSQVEVLLLLQSLINFFVKREILCFQLTASTRRVFVCIYSVLFQLVLSDKTSQRLPISSRRFRSIRKSSFSRNGLKCCPGIAS